MSLRELGLLFALGMLWGVSFIFIRVSASVLGPFTLVEARVGLAALALVGYLVAFGAVGGLREVQKRWRGFLLLGTLNAAMPFTLISAAQIELTASFGAILNSTTPMFGAIVAAVWLGDALTARKVAGLLLGLVGVGVLVGWSPIPLSAVVLLSVAASLAAAFFYGLGSAYAKRSFVGVSPLSMAVGQLGGAALVTLPFALYDGADVNVADISAVVIGAVLGIAFLSTALAYLIYFRLITSVGPTKTLTVTFLVPGFGVLLGALLLGEPVGGGTLPGLAIILASLLLVNEVRFRRVAGEPEVRSQKTG
ncbi:DMT family transporter [Rubrobacter indicoceani]|uniref:DMT family transporter n=1 Tax=Rubrobacter indicoceani TaxID=2051957 RepID=UPI000E5C20D1|nr:DMT family transporter [Rubrobacter indicoceani]